MLDAIKNILSDNEFSELAPGKAAKSELKGLNVTTAIESHMRWKARLAEYINGNSKESLDPEQIAQDDQSILGQWIYGIGGETFGDVPGFAELRECHARFHQCAADVVRKVDAGQQEEARQMLSTGDYARASMLVIRLLSGLWNRVH
ncbi:MAG: CZB domain-containing protein [Acidiferrobacterales bacterium]